MPTVQPKLEELALQPVEQGHTAEQRPLSQPEPEELPDNLNEIC